MLKNLYFQKLYETLNIAYKKNQLYVLLLISFNFYDVFLSFPQWFSHHSLLFVYFPQSNPLFL